MDRDSCGGGLPVIALAWLGGTLIVHQLPQLPGVVWYVPLALIALLGLRAAKWRWLTFAVAGFVWTASCAQWRLADRLPAELVGADLPVKGWIDSFPSAAPDRVRFSLRVVAADDERVPRRLRLTWYHPPLELDAGTELELVVRLRRPRGLVNPGGFDYERWLFVEGYGATGYVRSGGLATADIGGLTQRWLGLRARLAQRIAAASPSADAAALLTALTLGERFAFEERHWTSLRRTGTSHLVAISGMHVGLVAGLVFLLVRRLWLWLPAPAARLDLEAAALAAASAAASYAALAGFAVPTQRALVMVLVALTVLVGRRFVGLFDGLAAALILVLIWDPLAPLGASFWMSFMAVTVLLLMAGTSSLDPWPGTPVRRALRSVRSVVRLQWGITLALVPLVAFYFGELSLVSPLVNLLAIPFFSLVLVPLSLLAVATAAFGAGELLFGLVGWLAVAVWSALDAVSASEWAAVPMAAPPPILLALAFAGVLAAVPAHAFPARRLAWLALLPLAAPRAPETPAPLRATVLDVGHGLAVLVETRTRRLLYDAGPSYASGYDTGADVVLPVAELGAGDRALDVVMISHDHNDHTGGVASVLHAYPDAVVLKGPDIDRFGGGHCRAGQSWIWDDVVFSVLHPAPDFEWRGNESSCVLKAETAAGALLVTGDIEARAERTLRGREEVTAEVVVVPHHGSATSSSAGFVQTVRAELALVSTDYYSRWRFPRPEVRRRWQEAGARVLVTGESGAITVDFEHEGIRVRPERGRRARYWSAESTPLHE